MNRERILFVAVLAIMGLWFLMRKPERVLTSADVRPRQGSLTRRPILGSDIPARVLAGPEAGPELWTIVTNVRPHPRPIEELEKPKDFDLPNIWPPTSRSVSLEGLALLRRDGAAPQPGAATVTLPQVAAAGGGPAGGPTEDRVDTWRSGAGDWKGRVTNIFAGGANLKEPPFVEVYGSDVMKPEFKYWRALVLLPDPERASEDEGVTDVGAAASKMPFGKQRFPAEISGFQIAIEGKQQGYLRGLRSYLDVQRAAGPKAIDPRVQAGLALLQSGLQAMPNDKAPLRWSLALLDEARLLAVEGNQDVRRKILFAMLRAAGELNDYERVLALATDYLASFPEEQEVLEHVGDVLASRTFSLPRFSLDFFRRAGQRPYGQRRLIEELVNEGQFKEAQECIAAGRAGAAGAEQDLLKARVALALGDFAAAAAFAGRHSTSSEPKNAADAHQLLGAIAYAKGDAAGAAQEFEQAAKADPGRSTAFSDWGLALAVQGKTEDALLCFAHALELDAFRNAVAPEMGRSYLKLAAGEAGLRAAAEAEEAGQRDPKLKAEKSEQATNLRAAAKEAFAAAAEMLGKLRNDNPKDLLVRYMLGYAKERTGNLKEAAELYRATIDGDSRYRIAIARLGLVQAQRALAGEDKAALVPEAIAHLSKAVALSPTEAILPYVLARFLMLEHEEKTDVASTRLTLASQMFEAAGKLPVSERNGNLPLWADLGVACLAYADEKTEELKVKSLLIVLLDRIKDKMPSGMQEPELMKHEVYRAARIDFQIVEDNERKVDKTWDLVGFSAKPTDWKSVVKNPMEMHVETGKGLVFGGKIDYGGIEKTGKVVIESCSWQYQSKAEELNGSSIWELEVTGTADGPAEFGVGLGQLGKTEEGLVGLLVKRKRTGNLEVKLEGGDRQVFKDARGKEPVELKQVPWPEGEFKLRIEVVPEYGTAKRRQGRFRLYLNGDEVFQKEFKDTPGERAGIFAPGRASQPIQLLLWVEGRPGDEIKGIQVKTVTLTVEKAR